MFDFKSRDKLDNPERRKAFPAKETLIDLGLRKGMDMADIGAGIGYFTIPAADIVGNESRVYGLDISEDMLGIINDRVDEKSIKNIDTVLTEEYDLRLYESRVDFVLMVNVLHEIVDKPRFINEVKKITRQGGYLSIIDFKEKRINNEGPPEDVRVPLEDAKRLLESLGYKIEKIIDYNESFYGIVGILI